MDCRPDGINGCTATVCRQHALQVDGVEAVHLDAVGGVPYTAVRGGGAYRDGEPIAVSATPVLDRALLVTGFRDAELNRSLPALCARVPHREPGASTCRRSGHGLCRHASGRSTGTGVGLNPWDVAAGVLLVQRREE